MRSYELELGQVSIEKTFDFQHLKAIHKHLFQDVYEWAGQVREVNVSKGETYFSPHSRIEQSAGYNAPYKMEQLRKERFVPT